MTVREAGLAALVAPRVVNDGVITAKAGRVTLGAGDTVTLDLYGDGLVSVAASGKMTGVTHTGSIVAPGGSVQLAAADAVQVMDGAVNMTGLIDVSGVEAKGGAITLQRRATARYTSAALCAPTAGRRKAARSQITGKHIRVGAGAAVTASGASGGGDIKIGGDYQGSGTLPHAKTTVIEEGARLEASATGRATAAGSSSGRTRRRVSRADSGQGRAAGRQWRVRRNVLEGYPDRARPGGCLRAARHGRGMAARSQ